MQLKPPVNARAAVSITGELIVIDAAGVARLQCNPASVTSVTIAGTTYNAITSGTPTGAQYKILTYTPTGGTAVNLPLLQFPVGDAGKTGAITYSGTGTSLTAEYFADLVAFLTPLTAANAAALPAATTDTWTRGRTGDTAYVGSASPFDFYVSDGTAWSKMAGGAAAADTTPPTVDTFTVGSPTFMTVPVTAFTASDNVSVIGYLITESATRPSANDSGWLGTAPASYQGSSVGQKTLYPWALDSSGNVSLTFGSPRTVTFTSDDVTAPVVTAFTVGSPSILTVGVTAFTATDAVGVTGYFITESATPPSPGASGWSGTAPTSYTAAAAGSTTLYPWAKDAAGNVSSVFGNPRTVNFPGDVTAPTVSTFTVGTPSGLSVPITAFAATDDVGVTGYLITENNTPPAAGAAGWSSGTPGTYTASAYGSVTLYPWAKDAAGNVSAAFGSPRTVTCPYPVPTGLAVTAGNGQLTATWTKVSGATGYYLRYAITSGGSYTTVTLGDVATATITGLTNGTTYYVVIAATDGTATSANSAEVTGVPNDFLVTDFSGTAGTIPSAFDAFTAGSASFGLDGAGLLVLTCGDGIANRSILARKTPINTAGSTTYRIKYKVSVYSAAFVMGISNLTDAQYAALGASTSQDINWKYIRTNNSAIENATIGLTNYASNGTTFYTLVIETSPTQGYRVALRNAADSGYVIGFSAWTAWANTGSAKPYILWGALAGFSNGIITLDSWTES